jgi:hypothetical protein
MQLFKQKPPAQTETAPTPAPVPLSPLAAAEAELQDAALACSESSKRCKRLDDEQRYWATRREEAHRQHSEALNRHAAAKDRWATLANPVRVKATGDVKPFPVGAVLGEN